MTRDRRKHKGRSESGGFFALPHDVTASPNFRALSAHAVKLLVDLGAQYRGGNNGDLSAAWRVLKPMGWRSRDTLARALAELQHFGLIEKTRQGWLNRCSLYALTWRPIDACDGKLDVSPTHVASGLWKNLQPMMPRKQKADTVGVSVDRRARRHRHGRRVSHGNFRPRTDTAGVSLSRYTKGRGFCRGSWDGDIGHERRSEDANDAHEGSGQ